MLGIVTTEWDEDWKLRSGGYFLVQADELFRSVTD